MGYNSVADIIGLSSFD